MYGSKLLFVCSFFPNILLFYHLLRMEYWNQWVWLWVYPYIFAVLSGFASYILKVYFYMHKTLRLLFLYNELTPLSLCTSLIYPQWYFLHWNLCFLRFLWPILASLNSVIMLNLFLSYNFLNNYILIFKVHFL